MFYTPIHEEEVSLEEQAKYLVDDWQFFKNRCAFDEGFIGRIVEKFKAGNLDKQTAECHSFYKQYRNFYSEKRFNRINDYMKKNTKYDLTNKKDIMTLYKMWSSNDYIMHELNYVTYKLDKGNPIFTPQINEYTPEEFCKKVEESKNAIKAYGKVFFAVRTLVKNYNNQTTMQDYIMEKCLTYGTADKMKIDAKWFQDKAAFIKNFDKCEPVLDKQLKWFVDTYKAIDPDNDEAKSILREFGVMWSGTTYYWAIMFLYWAFADLINILGYKAVVSTGAMRPSEATFDRIVLV